MRKMSNTPLKDMLILKSGIGFLAWAVFVYIKFRPQARLLMPQAETLFLFFALVLSPLALRLIQVQNNKGQSEKLFILARGLQGPAAIAALMSIILPPGWIAAGFASGWFFYASVLSLLGILRLTPWNFRETGFTRYRNLCLNASLLYLAPSALWLMSNRLDILPMDFSPPIVLLTAVHFSYAGFLTLLLTGLIGRRLKELYENETAPWSARIYLIFSIWIPIAPFIVALGIAFSPLLEAAAATLFALSVLGIALQQAFFGRGLPRGALLVVSGAALCISMSLAVLFALGEFTHKLWPGIPLMLLTHGVLNAFGFALPALIAYQSVDFKNRG